MSALPWQAHLLEVRSALQEQRFEDALAHARSAYAGAVVAGASVSDLRACRYYEADALLRLGEFPKRNEDPEDAQDKTLQALGILRVEQPPTKPERLSRSLLGAAVDQALTIALFRQADRGVAQSLFQERSLMCRAAMGVQPSALSCLELARVLGRPGLDWALGEAVASELREESFEAVLLGLKAPGADRMRPHLAKQAGYLVASETDPERKGRWMAPLNGKPPEPIEAHSEE